MRSPLACGVHWTVQTPCAFSVIGPMAELYHDQLLRTGTHMMVEVSAAVIVMVSGEPITAWLTMPVTEMMRASPVVGGGDDVPSGSWVQL